MSSEIERSLQKLFNSFYNIYKNNYEDFVDIFLRAYEHELHGLPDVKRLFVEDLINIIDMLRVVRIDTLHEMKDFIERYRANYRYIYVVDCLGLPELYALQCRASETGLINITRIFINQEATTRALKEVFGVETLSHVAEDVNGMVFRRLDTKLHEKFKEPKSRKEILDLLIGRMKYIISLSLEEGNTMIFSDHGYDVIHTDSKYTAEHAHIHKTKVALAKLAPVILLKRIR